MPITAFISPCFPFTTSSFSHFAQLHDVQTLAMLACVFQIHKFSVITKEQSDKKEKDLLKYLSLSKVLTLSNLHVHVHYSTVVYTSVLLMILPWVEITYCMCTVCSLIRLEVHSICAVVNEGYLFVLCMSISCTRA